MDNTWCSRVAVTEDEEGWMVQASKAIILTTHKTASEGQADTLSPTSARQLADALYAAASKVEGTTPIEPPSAEAACSMCNTRRSCLACVTEDRTRLIKAKAQLTHEVNLLRTSLEVNAWKGGSDKPLAEDEEIAAAHPTRSTDPKRWEHYANATRMVGARYSKGGLIELVCWLLSKRTVFAAGTCEVKR